MPDVMVARPGEVGGGREALPCEVESAAPVANQPELSIVAHVDEAPIELRVPLCDLASPIGRAVVHDEHRKVPSCLRQQRLDRLGEIPLTVECGETEDRARGLRCSFRAHEALSVTVRCIRPVVAIPHVFHQIWLGPDPFPGAYTAYQQTWRDHHPGWELRLWTEENLSQPLRRPEAAERLRVPAERANILRLELLWRFGGVYLDTDLECLRSIEPLIDGVDFFIGLSKPHRVNNALMGSVAGHRLLDEALDRIEPREYYGHDKAATGTRFLDTVLLGQPEVTFLAPELFYPLAEEDKREAYAAHDMARSWKDPELLRVDVQRAERKLRAAQDAELKWRLRCREAQAEVTRLRSAWPNRLRRLPATLATALRPQRWHRR